MIIAIMHLGIMLKGYDHDRIMESSVGMRMLVMKGKLCYALCNG